MIIAVIVPVKDSLKNTLDAVEHSIKRARKHMGREPVAVFGPRVLTDTGSLCLSYRLARAWTVPWSVWRRQPDMVMGEE